ncbi:MFS transporter [Variovorax sp. LjRoot290]|uniref:MFS transporter n=1 Tax=Variovorax sp. LjRoot290 TaxID=3342316 RepID=UPI003ECEEC94
MSATLPTGAAIGTAGTSATSAATPGETRKVITAVTLGNVVEWVDWVIYATFAPIFSAHFFPQADPVAGLLATFAVFAVGFVMRPLGGAILGPYSDKHGRKKGLTLSIGLMAGASLVIALCPTYASIGVAAPVILVLCRMVQGLSAGGEFGAASAYLVEAAPPSKRAFIGSFKDVGVNGGILVAALIGVALSNMLSPEALKDWGWRAGFAFAAALGLVTVWIRRGVGETAAFSHAAATGKTQRNPLLAMFAEHPMAALRVMGIAIAGVMLNYVWMVYFPTFANLKTGIPLKTALLANSIALVIFIVLLPFAGRVSDRFGRRPTLLFFSIGSALYAFPALHFMEASFWNIFVIDLIGMLLMLGYSANAAVVMAEQFPSEVRVTGISVPFAISVAAFGGTAPYILTAMTKGGMGDLIWIYLCVASLIGTLVYATMRETAGKPLL